MEREEKDSIGIFGWGLIVVFFGLLAYSAWLSWKAIDLDVLNRMEKQPLILPTPMPGSLPPEIEAQLKAQQNGMTKTTPTITLKKSVK
jgi:hypothetical protein